MVRIAIALVVICALTGAASAGLTVTVLFSPTAGLPGYTTWTVCLDSPEKVNAIDCRFDGPMHQVFAYGGTSETPFINSPGYSLLTAAQKALDSHFLLASSMLLVARTFHEDAGDGLPANKLAGWTVDAEGSFTGWTTGAVGIKAAYQQTSLQLAQLVVPDGQCVTLSGTCSFNGQTGGPAILSMPIPEPATLALLGLGGLAMIRRRR